MRNYETIGGKGKVCFSFDDYDQINKKVDETLSKHGIEATFYIETATPEAREQIKELFDRGNEIGCHTIHHPADLKALHHVEAMSEIDGAKRMVEAIIGRPCESFAYPRGRFNDDIVALVKKAGFKEARTTHVKHTKWEDPLRMPTTIHLYDGRKEYAGRNWSSLAEFYLDDVVKNGGTLSIWGHASELERDGTWERFDNILEMIGKKI